MFAATRGRIAIIGMAGRFPGAADVDELWELVRTGTVGLRTLTDEELVRGGVSRRRLADPSYVKVAGVLEDVARFDARFFGYGPRDAAILDPQHRHLLELAWTALEHSGHVPATFEGRIGVFAGCGANAYLQANLLPNAALMEELGSFLVRHTGNDKDFLATEIAYALDLTGPAITVQTACSTSLVAIHLAVRSLRSGECDLALAGGITIDVPHGRGYEFREGEILSRDGRCRAFDAAATGTVLASGGGLVVLRREEDALDDGDAIHAIVRGTAINNDGRSKVGYLAPSVDGHADVVAQALEDARVSPEAIQLFEAHGTGTAVGDPIEIAAVTSAYRRGTSRSGFCRLGSIKPNIGHLDTAAGVASLIKASLALEHGVFPPLAEFESPNPLVDLPSTPFTIGTSADPWPAPADGSPRLAAVSSLGVGGTNAHAVLEEPPARAPSDEPARPWQLLPVSAKSTGALDRALEQLESHLGSTTDPLADVAFTLQDGRAPFEQRATVVARSASEAATLVREGDRRTLVRGAVADGSAHVAFLIPGGGTQYAGMARGLYEGEAVFREAVDECLGLLEPLLAGAIERPLLDLLNADESPEATQALEDPLVSLLVVVVVEVGLARLYASLGIRPDTLVGHSLGEYVAAHLAGVVSLGDLLRMVVLRGTLMREVSGGAMASVLLAEDELRSRLPDGVDIAAVNAGDQCVVSGRRDAVQTLVDALGADGIEHRMLAIDVAAHSSMLDDVLEKFAAGLSDISFSPPQRPVVSTRTGTWANEELASPEHWVRHLRETVRFADAVETLAADGRPVAIELGPGHALGSFARAAGFPASATIPSLRRHDDEIDDMQFFLSAVGKAWTTGVEVDWLALHGDEVRNRVVLPTYAFERDEHWIEPVTQPAHQDAIRLDPDDWYHDVEWQTTALARRDAASGRWLVLADRGSSDGAAQVAEAATRGGARASVVLGDEVDLGSEDRVAELIERAESDGGLTTVVLLAGGDEADDRVFRRLVAIARALMLLDLYDRTVSVVVVTRNGAGLPDDRRVDPYAALTAGACAALARELPAAHLVALDLGDGDLDAPASELVVTEAISGTATHVALRDGVRYTRHLAPTTLKRPTAPPLRPGATWLITGGLGGMGLALADWLAAGQAANLVLTGRTGLPPREQWDVELGRRSAGPTARRIRAVRALEARGATVEVLVADVTDAEALRAVVDGVLERHGALHGVIHCAGVLDDALLAVKDDESIDRVLAPKVAGTVALGEATRHLDLDLLLLCSSVSAFVGLPGQVDYAAANAFMDAYAAQARKEGRTSVVSVAWGMWADVGMLAPVDERPAELAAETNGSAHPLLGSQIDGSGRFVHRGVPTRHWMFDEHRVSEERTPVLPGTGHLQLMASALDELVHEPYVLEDVTFLAPMVAPALNEVLEREVHVDVGGNGSWSVTTSSSTDRPGASTVHASATAHLVEVSPVRLDLEEITSRCEEVAPTPLQPDHLHLGPRWVTPERVWVGAREALAELRLPERFHADLDSCPLHPALLDVATAFALSLVPHAEDALYVPLSYGRLVRHGSLAPHMLSYARLHPDGSDRAAIFDVKLALPDGTVVLEAERFVMVKTEGFVQEGTEESRTKAEGLAHLLPLGIAADEGTGALEAVIASGRERVIVSSLAPADLEHEADLLVRRPAPVAQRVSRPELVSDWAAPADEIEAYLVELWQELLGVDSVGVDDDFFDLGGHSLVAVRLFTRLRKQYGMTGSLSLLFEAPTVRRLATLVRRETGVAEPSRDATAPTQPAPTVEGPVFKHLVPLQPKGSLQPFFCIHGRGGNVLNFVELARVLGERRPVYGVQALGVDPRDEPHASIEEMAAAYIAEIQQVQPEGPYLLGGHSGGGVIAFEVAHQLRRIGQQAGALVLFDSYSPGTNPLSVKRLIRRLQARLGLRAVDPNESLADRVDLPDHLTSVETAYIEAEHRYRTTALAEPRLTLIRAELRDAVTNAWIARLVPPLRSILWGYDYGWRRWSNQPVDVHFVEGDHNTMLERPHLFALARVLHPILARADDDR